MSSSSSSASASDSASGPEQQHLSPPPEQLLFTDCKNCDTYLAVCVPRTSSGDNSIWVRCGHCASILTVNNIRFPLLEWYRRNSPPPNTPPEEMDQLSTPPPPQTSD